MNPALIAALIGAAMGAGKTALNKDTRKSPGAYIGNTLGGAASGYMAGSPGNALVGQISMDAPSPLMAGVENGPLPGGPGPEPQPQPEPGQRRPPPGQDNKAMIADLLKAWLSRPRTTINNNQIPGIEAPGQLAFNPIQVAPRAPLPYPDMPPMFRR